MGGSTTTEKNHQAAVKELETLISKALKKIGGTKENEVCRFLPMHLPSLHRTRSMFIFLSIIRNIYITLKTSMDVPIKTLKFCANDEFYTKKN